MAKSRSEAIEARRAGAQAAADLMRVKGSLPRTPDGHINNCALAHGEPEETCQMCDGHCPDRAKYSHGEDERSSGGPVVEELTLTVTWGEETFQPVQFHGFRIGPISATAKVCEGQSIAAVYRELWAELDALGQEQFEAKLAGMLERIKRCGKAAYDAKEQSR